MDNFSRNEKNEDHTPTTGKRSKTEQRWTLLFIGNHGKTITLKRFKGIVILTGMVLAVSLAISLGLLYFGYHVYQEKDLLASELQELKAQMGALRYEKDVLMTKLVLAESRTKPDPAEKKAGTRVSSVPREKKVDSQKPAKSIPTAKSQKEPPPAKKPSKPALESVSEMKLSVKVENFQAIPKTDENLLRVRFKIKNTTPNSQRVSGHAIVVLKSDPAKPKQWLTIPTMALVNGKPSGRQRGYPFGISNYKTMRLKTNLPTSPEIFQSATVFVFTQKGDKLLETDFPVSLPAIRPVQTAAAIRPAPAAARAPSPDQPSATESPSQPAIPTPVMPSTDELMDALKNPATSN